MESKKMGYLVECSHQGWKEESKIPDEHDKILCSPEYLPFLLQEKLPVTIWSVTYICLSDYKKKDPEIEVYEIGKRKEHPKDIKPVILGTTKGGEKIYH